MANRFIQDGLALAGTTFAGNYALNIANMGISNNLMYLAMGASIGTGILLDWLFKESNYEKLFKMCGLENKNKQVPLIIKKEKYFRKTTLVLHLPAGLSQKHFEQKQEELEQFLKCKIKFGYNDNLIMELIEVTLRNEYPFVFEERDNPLEFYFGETNEGSFYLDIEKSQHLIIGGATDSGKSSGITDMILSLLLSKHNIDLHLHDFQDISLGVFENCKKVKSYGKTPEEFDNLLDEMSKECEKRLKLFRSVKEKIYVEKLAVWNKEFPKRALPYKVVIVDEFGRLSDKDCEPILEKFKLRVQMDRKAGIHYVIVLHRCSVDMLSGSIKNNMPTRISFRTATQTDSKVILDESGAEKLKTQGRCLLMNYDGLTEIQTPYIKPKNITKLLKEYNAIKTKEDLEKEKQMIEEELQKQRKQTIEKFRHNYSNPYSKE